MVHVLVVGKVHPAGLALLESTPDVTYDYVDGLTEESYAPLIPKADALMIRTQPLGAATIASARRLKIVSRHGVGYDAVDVAALNARGIPLAICGEANATSVAEHAAMMLLAASKRALRADRAVRNGAWSWRNGMESTELRGRNLLLVGFGRVGRHVATMMGGFGMTIRAHDPSQVRRGWPEGPVAPVASLHEGLAWADAISLSVPRRDKPVIGPAEFAAMKPGVVLVNTARGGVVDEAALVEALRTGIVGAAGLDVFEQEPLPRDHPLAGFDQVLLSPHIAGVTADAAERMVLGALNNILDFFAGRIDPALVVNRDHVAGVL